MKVLDVHKVGGADRVLCGSDYPHIIGAATPCASSSC